MSPRNKITTRGLCDLCIILTHLNMRRYLNRVIPEGEMKWPKWRKSLTYNEGHISVGSFIKCSLYIINLQKDLNALQFANCKNEDLNE